jgi:aarF domain-containing kinase
MQGSPLHLAGQAPAAQAARGIAPRRGRAPPPAAAAGGPGAAQAAGAPRPRAPRQSDLEQLSSRLQELTKLAQEAAEIAVASGPAGIRRTASAAEALLSVGRDQLARVQSSGAPDPPPAVLRQLFERLGATYIKLGQFVASSPTLFPPDYVLEFQKCLDATDPVPFAVIRATIEAELGVALEDVFESVEQTALASASVAQVHAAVLRGSRQDVAIKVLKPGVEDALSTDLNFLYLAARLAEVAAPGVSRASLSAIASDIRASMLQECDFREEAAHLGHFAAYLDATGLRALATCPSLYRQYCTRRVLVMERLRGAPLTDLAAVRRVTRADPEAVLINALNVWFGSVVGAETFHADVHAGNLLVLPDGRVGFIDFGIVGRISQPTWRACEALLRSTAAEDYDTMARALVTIGAASGEVDYAAFAADLRRLFDSLRAVDAEVILAAGAGGAAASVAADDAAVNRVLLDLVRVGEDNGVRFPREFALLLKQVLYFDRYTRILAPSLRVFDDDRISMGSRGGGGGAGKGDVDWEMGPEDYRLA